MRNLYIPFWWKSGDMRGECYQHIQEDNKGAHALVGYVDDTGARFAIPEPHEGVLLNPRSPLDSLPNAPEPTPEPPHMHPALIAAQDQG